MAIDAQGMSAGQLNSLKARLNALQAKLAAGQSASRTYRLSGDAGSATAALYPMVFILAPVDQAGQAIDATLAAMLDEMANITRWRFFPAGPKKSTACCWR